MTKNVVFTVSELNKKIAFIKGNRAISQKNLNQKIESIKDCGQLMPIVIVDGGDAAAEGLTLVDCKTNEFVQNSEVNDYVAVIEGQHRYESFMKLQEEDKKNNTILAPVDIYAIYALNPKQKKIKKLISELNKTSIVWDGKDFVTGAALCNPTNELLKYAKELADMKSASTKDGFPKNGYPLSTISKIITFGISLDKAKVSGCMDNGTECLPTGNIDRAKRIIDAAIRVGFKHQYLAHRYFIDWVIDESNVQNEDVYCGLISGLSASKVEKISKIKGDNYIAEIRKIVNSEDSLEEVKAA